MELSDASDPYCPSRPARRTQWLVSALAYHYGLDRGVENEIIVLATGLDQYLQEIFHHLDCQGLGTIRRDEFQTLCEVLGLEQGMEAEECEGLLEDLPEELNFRHFHARLCGYFSTKAGCQPHTGRLPVGKESEHIETQIRLRSPLRRRHKHPVATAQGRHSTEAGACSRDCYEEIVALEQAEDRIVKLEDENTSLRELVEDMRAALQSSDARCLALQVGLRKSHTSQKPTGDCMISDRRVLSHSYTLTTRCVHSVHREVNFIQSSTDNQVEEVIRINQELEGELEKSQKALVYLEDSNHQLKREQADMRRKAEEARQAVLKCFGKVKDLEEKSNQVSFLQMHIKQLELELQRYRSEARMLRFTTQETPEQRKGALRHMIQYNVSGQPDRRSPTGDAVEDQMFRSVEGQAASDEEEEKWVGEQRYQISEVKRLLTSVSCCSSGCDDRMIKKLLTCIGRCSNVDYRNTMVFLVEKIARLTEQLEMKEEETKKFESILEEMKDPFIEELEKKVEEIELLKLELQMLETERVRLSLVEEKLLDDLQLLQQLRDLKIPKRELGRILLNTLESCREPQHEKEHVSEVLDTLYQELSVCELLQSPSLNKSDPHSSLANSLVISC